MTTEAALAAVEEHCGDNAEVWRQVQQLVRAHPQSAGVLAAVVAHVASLPHASKRHKTSAKATSSLASTSNQSIQSIQSTQSIQSNQLYQSNAVVLPWTPSLVVSHAHWLQPRRKEMTLLVATRPRLALAVVSGLPQHDVPSMRASSLASLPHGATVDAMLTHDDILRIAAVPLPASAVPAALLKALPAGTPPVCFVVTPAPSAPVDAPLVFALWTGAVFAASAKDHASLVRMRNTDAAGLLPALFPVAWVDPVRAVPCYLKAKEGSLVLYKEGVLFGIKKPVLSWAHAHIRSMEAVGATSRTFDIRLTVVDGDVEKVIDFGMVDTCHYEHVVAYLTSMRFGQPLPTIKHDKHDEKQDAEEEDDESDDDDYEYNEHQGSSCDEEYDSDYNSSNDDDDDGENVSGNASESGNTTDNDNVESGEDK